MTLITLARCPAKVHDLDNLFGLKYIESENDLKKGPPMENENDSKKVSPMESESDLK